MRGREKRGRKGKREIEKKRERESGGESVREREGERECEREREKGKMGETEEK